LRPGRADRGPPGPHPRRAGAPCPLARAVHRRGGGDDGEAVTDRSALMRTYADPPVSFVRGEGTLLFDTEGRRYLDFVGGLAVTSLGHAHPAVTEAIAAQAATLTHVSNLYGNEIGPEVAVTLDRLVGGG